MKNISYYKWPVILGMLLLTGIAVDIGFIAVALSSGGSLVESEPYLKGRSYEKEIVAQRNVLEQGINVTFNIERSQQDIDKAFILVKITKEGRPLSGIIPILELVRPDESISDKVHTLSERDMGFYGVVTSYRRGLWLTKLKFKDDEKEFQFRSRIVFE